MTIVGNSVAREAFDTALASGTMHHGWLLAGPRGVGKAGFAAEATIRLLTRPGEDRGDVQALLAAGSHPRFRRLERLPRDEKKPEGGLARNISIEQVRNLQSLFSRTVERGERRVVLIDAIDDLERPSANALLKNLEEPPPDTVFLLISHAPGRLLPTIRSRCRLLRFAALDDADVAAVVRDALPEAGADEVTALVRAGAGSLGRAIGFAGLDLASIERDLGSIAETGDRDNAIRVRLAKALALKSAQERYAAFLDRVPGFIAERARTRTGAALRDALDAYAIAREIGGAAIGLSQEPGGAVFETCGVVARLARTP